MEDTPKSHRVALAITRWIGSLQSIFIHTLVFAGSFALTFIGWLPFDQMLLILTTILSLEAIYLALFIQMTVNYTTTSIKEVGEDIEGIQEDMGEIQEDIEEISEDVDELQEDVEEISEDVEEIQEDVGEITEEASEDELRNEEHRRTLSDIQRDLRKLMEDIDRLKTEEEANVAINATVSK